MTAFPSLLSDGLKFLVTWTPQVKLSLVLNKSEGEKLKRRMGCQSRVAEQEQAQAGTGSSGTVLTGTSTSKNGKKTATEPKSPHIFQSQSSHHVWIHVLHLGSRNAIRMWLIFALLA